MRFGSEYMAIVHRIRGNIFFYAILAVLLPGAVQHAEARDRAVSGTVKKNTGEPLVDVNVYLEGTAKGAVTGSTGRFVINGVPPGAYILIASRIGYETARSEISVAGDESVSYPIVLAERPLTGEEIMVVRERLIGNPDRIFDTPGSAHYIGKEELKRFEHSDIHRILGEIPGVYMQEEDGYGLRPNIGMRGTGVERTEKISVMEDGVLIAPAPYSAPAAYYFPTAGRMEAFEIRKGSSQIQYGPFTTGGALNMISTGIPNRFGGQAHITAGENDTRRVHAHVGDSFKNFGFLVETYQMNADGFKRLDNGGNTGFDKKDYMFKFRINTDPDAGIYQALTIKTGQADEESHETYLGLTEDDFRRTPFRRYAGSQNDLMSTRHEQYQASYFIKPSDRIDFTATLYRNNFKRNWYKLDRVGASSAGTLVGIGALLANPEIFADEYAIVSGAAVAGENRLMVRANNRSYYSKGVHSSMNLHFGGEDYDRHEIQLGIRFHEDEADRFQWDDRYTMEDGVMKLRQRGAPGSESNRVEHADARAAYLQYRYGRGNLNVTPGLRFESMKLSQYDYGKSDPHRTGIGLNDRRNEIDVWIPGIGVDYSFVPRFSVFAGIHKGFSPPGTRQGTQPEISINYELGSRYRKNAFNVQGVIFFNDYDNLLGADLAAVGGEGSGDLYNGGAVEVKGVEVTANHDIGWAMQLEHVSIPVRLAYTLTRAEFKNSFRSDYEPWGVVTAGDELPYIPKHMIAAGAGMQLRRTGLFVNARYMSMMRNEAGSGAIDPLKSTDARLIFDASAEYRFTQANTVFLEVLNLTDRVYRAARRPAGLRPGLPRTILTGIRTDF